jgi:hypothetical protein
MKKYKVTLTQEERKELDASAAEESMLLKLKSLSRFGISDERMFPEMLSSARVIKGKLKI